MRLASLDEFARQPVGRYVKGERFVHFCASPELWGVVLWGRPDVSDARELGRSLIFELAAPAVPHSAMVDASRIHHADPHAFSLAERYLVTHADALSHSVVRLALVRPLGMEGAIVAGAYQVLPRPYPVAVFGDAAAALAWLEAEGTIGVRASDAACAIERAYVEVSSAPRDVARLRDLLGTHLSGIAVKEAATLLGLSERTLQRRLAEAGTSFLEELGMARLRAAQRLLLEGDAPLTTIAFDVGCASLQHLNALFRKRTGASPSQWRQRHGRAAKPSNVGSGRKP